MTVRFKSPFDEERVCPWLSDLIVEPGGEISVPDEQWENWVAGGWTPLDPDPNPKVNPDPRTSPVPAPAPPTPPAAAPAPAPAPPATPAPATSTSVKGPDA